MHKKNMQILPQIDLKCNLFCCAAGITLIRKAAENKANIFICSALGYRGRCGSLLPAAAEVYRTALKGSRICVGPRFHILFSVQSALRAGMCSRPWDSCQRLRNSSVKTMISDLLSAAAAMGQELKAHHRAEHQGDSLESQAVMKTFSFWFCRISF